MAPAVTVIVPFTSDGPYLQECIARVQAQTFREFDVVLVPDAASACGAPGVRVIPSGAALPNRKRQIAAGATDAPIVAFIDDDAYPAPGWLAAAMRHFDDRAVVACGGPAVTPLEDSARRRAGGAVFASALVTAGTRHRYVPAAERYVDALPSCNLLIRRDAFLRDADASSRYWPGEDMLTCAFATRAGERIVYDPAALVYHHRRALFAAHLGQVWTYGVFRGFYLRHFSRSRSDAAYAVPAAFVAAHALVLPLALHRRTRIPAALAIGIYAGLVASSALREARLAGANPLLVAAGVYMTHVTYGAATLCGWIFGRGNTRPRGKNGS